MSCKGSVCYGRYKDRYWHAPNQVETLRNAKDLLQPGFAIPDEANARPYCLCKGVDAPDLVVVKNFLRFYIATNCGEADENERPTTDFGWHLLLSGSLPASAVSRAYRQMKQIGVKATT